jgi:hypothetical protein
MVGSSHICAAVSDSTGNTRLFRELLVEEIPTIFNFPDIVYFIISTIKDIVKLEYFKGTTTVLRSTTINSTSLKSHPAIPELKLELAPVECHIIPHSWGVNNIPTLEASNQSLIYKTYLSFYRRTGNRGSSKPRSIFRIYKIKPRNFNRWKWNLGR